MELLIEYAEKKARDAIRAIPNGVFEFTDYMDHDGVDLTRPIKIKVRLEVRDDSFHFDFTGTDPQVRGPLNAPLSSVDHHSLLRAVCAARTTSRSTTGLPRS
jgi:N-methylhydantoinase B